MKLHVVHQVLCRVAQRGVHAGDLLRHERHLLACCTLCGKSRDTHLEGEPGLKHLVRSKPMKRRQHLQRTRIKRWRFLEIRDEGSGTLARDQYSDSGERTDARTQRRTTD